MAEEIYQIADDRVEVAVEARTVHADGQLLEQVSPLQFDLLATLASKPDNIFPWAILSQEVLDREDNRSSRASLRERVVRVRDHLGDELGDNHEGAIRARQGVGYYAVSSLTSTLESFDQGDNALRRIAGGRVAIHLDKWVVTRDDQVLDITPTEYRILNLLSKQPDVPQHIAEICKEIWGGR
jgi:DNA-binding response OmpR family regulator